MLVQFKHYLETKGIKPTTEVEGQITFLSNSLYYLFVYDSTDPNYFRIILPNVFKVESGVIMIGAYFLFNEISLIPEDDWLYFFT